MDLLDKYLQRTGQTEQDAFAGAAGHGFAKVMELIAEAESKNKKLVWYYKNKNDRECDIVSYKFE